jgi:glycosyltransferase involved in cell wall biosynthesis
MKILFTRFPLESAYGGAEIQTMTLMRGLMARKHAVAFLGSCPTLLKLCREEGIPSAELDIGPPPVTPWLAASFLWRRMRMGRTLRKHLAAFSDLDAVFMLSLSEKIVATEWLAERGTTVFWIEHDRMGRWLWSNPWFGMLLNAAGRATTVVVSRLSKRMYEQIGFDGARVAAVPNGIEKGRVVSGQWSVISNENKKQEIPSELTTDHSKLITNIHEMVTIGCIARFSQEKGIDVLLRAAAMVPEVRVELTGKGREEGMLRRLAIDLGISERVVFHPPESNVAERYAAMDVLVLPSRDHDPFGLVAAEAMSVGVPVVVTDACGIAEELHDGEDALVVKADDAEALAGALRRLMDAEERRRIGEAGKKIADETFSSESMIEKYERLLTGEVNSK